VSQWGKGGRTLFANRKDKGYWKKKGVGSPVQCAPKTTFHQAPARGRPSDQKGPDTTLTQGKRQGKGGSDLGKNGGNVRQFGERTNNTGGNPLLTEQKKTVIKGPAGKGGGEAVAAGA